MDRLPKTDEISLESNLRYLFLALTYSCLNHGIKVADRKNMLPPKTAAIAVFAMSFIEAYAYVQDYEVTVSTVTVWVKVTDSSGAPIQGLSRDDFEVYEDGNRLELTCLEETAASPVSEGAVASGAESGSAQKLVIYLDLLNISSPEIARIKPKLMEFLDQIAGKDFESMLVAMLPQGKLGIIVPYTRDIIRLKSMVQKAPPNVGRDQEIVINENRIFVLLNQLRPESNEEGAVDSIEDLTGVNQARDMNTNLIRQAIRLADSYAKEERSRAELTLHALESFANVIAEQNPQDRTILVFISGGINSDPGRRYYDYIIKITTAKHMQENPFVYSIRVGDDKKFSDFDIPNLVKKSVGRLNRHNVTLYSINTRGMASISSNTASDPIYAVDETRFLPYFQEALNELAGETGGLSFLNSQNFQVGFDLVLNDLDHSYVLCYQEPEHKKKHSYHSIRVVCNQAGAKVRHRNGYID